MRLYNLKEDRADVIVPALQIYVNVMRWIDAEEIFVPKIGLADGLIQALYRKYKPYRSSVHCIEVRQMKECGTEIPNGQS
jgi:exopolyphosphatase/pppGpp-phosphohydrolase